MEGAGLMIELLRDLKGLREQAPPALLDSVMAEVGLSDSYVIIDSALGPVAVAFGTDGITAVVPVGAQPRSAPPAGDPGTGSGSGSREEDFVRAYRARRRRALQRAGRAPVGLLDRPRFDLGDLTAFERDVLTVTRTIPAGQVRPYSWVAREIGRPGAVRAVGSALGRNPVPLLIPCHRVVRSDGRIGDYAFGPDAKRAVLASEGTDPAELDGWARRGTRYLGSDTTHIYCFPTCHHARRITEPHRVSLRTAAAAEAAGYRPCKVCRP